VHVPAGEPEEERFTMTRTIHRRLPVAMFAVALVAAACGGSAGRTPAASAPAGSGDVAPAASVESIPPIASGPVSSDPGTAQCATGTITSLGSTALQPLVDQASRDYMSICPGSMISVQGGGSGTGLTQVSQGGADIGNSDIEANTKLSAADAAALVDHKIVKQGFVMVTNGQVVGVSTLSIEQVQDIWTGKVTNWQDVGGPNLPIVLILRPQSSGTRYIWRQIVLKGKDEASGQALTEDSNGAVTAAVGQTPGATSVIGFAYYATSKGLQGIALDGIEPTVDNMSDGSYPVWAFGHLYTKGEATGLSKSFIDYLLGDHVQHQLAPSLSYAPVN
jgi:phosphate transport system substrate-binding protein